MKKFVKVDSYHSEHDLYWPSGELYINPTAIEAIHFKRIASGFKTEEDEENNKTTKFKIYIVHLSNAAYFYINEEGFELLMDACED